MPKYEVVNGEEVEIVYGVNEIEVAGYSSYVGALTNGKITVTNRQKTTELEVEKVWVNADGNGNWPAGVEVTFQLTKKVGEGEAEDVSGKTLTLSAAKTSDKFKRCEDKRQVHKPAEV